MASRLELSTKLRELLGSENVYYQPLESMKMNYPAIVYSKNYINTRKADDMTYSKITRYTITVIDNRPDNETIDKLLGLPYCSFDSHYVADNLNHDVLTLYF